MPLLNPVFATSSNSHITQPTVFDQSLPDSSQQLPFPSVTAPSLQFKTFSTVPPPSFDPNFNAVTTTPLVQLPGCSDNFWHLPSGDTSLYSYSGSRILRGDIAQAAATADNNENMDDSRQDASLWRPY